MFVVMKALKARLIYLPGVRLVRHDSSQTLLTSRHVPNSFPSRRSSISCKMSSGSSSKLSVSFCAAISDISRCWRAKDSSLSL